MAEPKTKATKLSVAGFLRDLPEGKRQDTNIIIKLMAEIAKDPPVMWGASIVGFGKYHYVYASGREGDCPMIAVSPRKQSLTIYIMPGFSGFEPLLAKLGKHTTSVSCLYIKRLSDIDLPTLKAVMKKSVAIMRKKYQKGRSARIS